MKISFHKLFLWHRMWVFILCPGLFKIGGGEHMTCGILVPKQGLNWGHWQWEFKVLTTGLPGSSLFKKQLKDSCACVLSCVWLFATSWTVAHQAPLSLGFARQEYWSGLPFPPPGDLPDPGKCHMPVLFLTEMTLDKSIGLLGVFIFPH